MSTEADRIIADAIGDKLETEPDCLRLSDLCPYTHDDLYKEPPCDTCEHWGVKPPAAHTTSDSAARQGLAILCRKIKYRYQVIEAYSPRSEESCIVSLKLEREDTDSLPLIEESQIITTKSGRIMDGLLAAALEDAMVEEYDSAELDEFHEDLKPAKKLRLKPALAEALEAQDNGPSVE